MCFGVPLNLSYVYSTNCDQCSHAMKKCDPCLLLLETSSVILLHQQIFRKDVYRYSCVCVTPPLDVTNVLVLQLLSAAL